jgi:hypothetical protein
MYLPRRIPNTVPRQNTTKMSKLVIFVTVISSLPFHDAGTEAGCYQIRADTPVCPYRSFGEPLLRNRVS